MWPWTYWYGPLGWSTAGGDETHWVATPGSPQLWIVYLLALCALGALTHLLARVGVSDVGDIQQRVVALLKEGSQFFAAQAVLSGTIPEAPQVVGDSYRIELPPYGYAWLLFTDPPAEEGGAS